MNTDRRRAIAALTAAGLLWGTTVPLSKPALGWLAAGWLTFVRFGLAAATRSPWPPAPWCVPPARPPCWPRARSGTAGRSWAERRNYPHQRQSCGAAGRSPRRWSPSSLRGGPDGGAPGGLGGLRGVAGRRWPGPGPEAGQRDGRRRWPGAGVAVAVGGVHGGAGPACAAATGRGDRGAVPGGGAGRAASRWPRRACLPSRPASAPRWPSLAGWPGDAAAVHAVRLRAGPGVRRGGRCLPRPGAARRRGGGRRLLRRPGLPGAARRRRGHPGGHRPEQPSAAGRLLLRPGYGRAAPGHRRGAAPAPAVPAATAQKSAAAEAAAPQRAVPEPAAPEPAAPERAAPERAAPQPAAPEAAAPEPRHRNAPPRRPPPKPGSARRTAYRAAARACRWR